MSLRSGQGKVVEHRPLKRGDKGVQTKHRAWLILALGLLLIVIVDRMYAVNIASYAVQEEPKKVEERKHEKQRPDSPVLSFIADVEDQIEAHEKLLIVLATIAIAVFTATLWTATEGLFRMAERQAKDMEHSLTISRKAADAAKESADSAVKSAMPVLFPYVTDMSRLHPLHSSDTPITHDANILIGFDNYGKTPGIIKQVRAQLFLTERDELPQVDIEKLADHVYSVIVPGEARGKDLMTGALDLKQTITLNPTELSELLSEAKDRFRRFALIGRVIYDDLFGNRHTNRFCIKLRSWMVPTPTGGVVINVLHAFQVAQGGSRYNKVTSERTPEPDPLEPTG